MTERRFTDKAELDPAAVRSLPKGHPALVENRTLFPSTVVDVTEEFDGHLLVSGANNRKLGKTITKGRFKGYMLYGLSLEERATCPTSCEVRAFCYGNGMQMARRHRITDLDLFCTFLEDEIRTILTDPVPGLMVRLHVLGDFPSVEYVAFWADMLDKHDRLACYGYTHRLVKAYGGDVIGDAISSFKGAFPDRFRIRWSSTKPMPDGAIIVDKIPEKSRIAEGLVCPAQTDDTACCASCALCWEGSAKKESIVFIKHGPKSLHALAESFAPVEAKAPTGSDVSGHTTLASENIRPIESITIAQKKNAPLASTPEMRHVKPTELKIEPTYQRDLSGKSIKLIRKIVTDWDWAKFKPPICAETPHGLFVIDGQHTAIAAASHPEIQWIPVMIVKADQIERRAEAFVAHNRDRLVMTPAQVFYGEVAAGNRVALAVLSAVNRAGASIPRVPVARGYAKPGQIMCISRLREIYVAQGVEVLDRVLAIAAATRVPISLTVIAGLRTVLSDKQFARAASLPNQRIAAALASIKDIETTSGRYAAEIGERSRLRACAILIAKALGIKEPAA